MRTKHFPGKTVRIILSLLAAFFIVLNGRWHLIHKALVSPSFYVAVLVSFLIAYLMLTVVHSATAVLDKRVPWHAHLWKRIVLQLLFGVVAPCMLDVAMAAVYISATGQNFLDSGFMLYDFPIIAGFILLINIFYVVLYLMYGEIAPKPTQNLSEPEQSCSMDSPKDIAYCCRMGRRVRKYGAEGTEIPTYQSLCSLLEQYRNDGLIQINRSTLINIKMVSSYYQGQKRNSLQIVLKDKYKNLTDYENDGLFVVTKEYIKGFLDAFGLLSDDSTQTIGNESMSIGDK